MRFLGFLGLAIYIPLPPLWAKYAEVEASLVRISNWAIIAPTTIVVLALSYTRFRRWMNALVIIAILAQTLALIWLFIEFYGPTDGVVTLTAVFGMFLPLAFRLPMPWTALVVVIDYVIATTLWVQSIRAGEASLAEAWPYLAFMTTIAMLVLSVALIAESGLRRQFTAERTTQASQLLLRRYAPAAVADRILSGDAEAVGRPQRIRVTALSSDVAGFTALADRIDPEALSQVIDEYMAAMSDAVEGKHGVVTEYAGDGLMAIFGAPEDMDPTDQVRHALSAAAKMHARLDDLNRSWFRLGIEQPLEVRIGINTGVLSVGTFGSSGRATYTAIGLQMNIAARIQAKCEPGTTLLSSSSWHLVNDEVSCEPLGEVTVKGVHFPISIYQPKTD
ncbi:MAG TPA: adenylate/guanylate cyclase domain-containing protein [Aeromicrobium sp.]|nr:adenylate/guanylate cyclase domain-containing protein [Aeromicrobium sp.]